MIKMKNFHPDDLLFFKLDEPVEDFDNQMLVNAQDPNKDIVSLVTGSGKVIAFAGINHLRTGVAEAWVVRGQGINNNKLKFYKAIKGLVEFVIEEMRIHRFELAISHEFVGGSKWARALGFRYEHTAEAYDCNYINHDIFVRITRWQQEQP